MRSPRRRRPSASKPPRSPRMPSSRSSRCRSLSAARRAKFTCAATPISSSRTAASGSRPSNSRSTSRMPASRSAPTFSPRSRAPMPACAGMRSPSTTATPPRTRSIASSFRRRCSIWLRRPRCRGPRSSSRTSRQTARPTIAPSSSWCSTTSRKAAWPCARARRIIPKALTTAAASSTSWFNNGDFSGGLMAPRTTPRGQRGAWGSQDSAARQRGFGSYYPGQQNSW